MANLLEILLEDYRPDGDSHKAELDRVRVLNDIKVALNENLTEDGTIFQFEIPDESELAHAVEVIESDDIQLEYEVYQIGPTMFEATRRIIDIEDLL